MKKNEQNAREIKTTKNTWHFKNRFIIFFSYTQLYISTKTIYLFLLRTYFVFLMLYLVIYSFDFTNINFLTWQCKVAPSNNQFMFTANLFQYIFIYFHFNNCHQNVLLFIYLHQVYYFYFYYILDYYFTI